MRVILNVIWLVLAGLWLALVNLSDLSGARAGAIVVD